MKPNSAFPHLWEGIGLTVVLGTAAGLRLGWPGVHSFGYDEARVSLLALQMARQRFFIATGIPSSSGIPNLPAFIWLMTPFYALSSDPLIASLGVGGLGVLAVFGLWYLACRAWGPWTAFTAGILLATSPYAVFYSRNIWSQDLLIFIAILWALAGTLGASRNQGGWLALYAFLSLFAGQVHYSGFVLIFPAFWFVIRWRLWRFWPWLVGGSLVAVLTALPFAIAMTKNPQTFANLAPLEGTNNPFLNGLYLWISMGLGSNWESLSLGGAWQWPQGLALTQRFAQGLTGLLIIMGGIALCSHRRSTTSFTDTAQTLFALLPAWALVPPLLFALSGLPARPQYYLVALPALFLIAGAATLSLFPRRPAWFPAFIAVAAVVIAIPQSITIATSIQTNKERLSPGGLGTPLLYPRLAVSLLKDGLPIYVHARSDATEYDADAAGMSVLLWGYPHRIVNGSIVLLLPAEGQGAHLLFPFPDIPALDMALFLVEPVHRYDFPRRQGEPPYVAITVKGAVPRGLQPIASPPLANGAILRGWHAYWESESLHLVTWWEITEAFQPGTYHQFNHLYSQSSEGPLQVKDAPLSSGAWQVGDRVVSWATFTPQGSGPFWFEIGMYSYPDLNRIPQVHCQEDACTFFRLGPIE